MFENEEEVCFLGVPQGAWKMPTHETFDKTDSSRMSKIGGYAKWIDDKKIPDLSDLTCKNCGMLDDIVLVSQVFTPMEIDRTLYLFCCNKRECSIKSEGWIAIRNQESKIDCQNKAKIEPAELSKPPPPPIKVAKDSVWDFLSDDGGIGGDDLMDLLTSRDASLLTIKDTKKVIEKIEKVKEEDPKLITLSVLPLCSINEIEEDWDPEFNNDDYDFSSNIGGETHINTLLDSYLNEEEDEENLVALKTAGLKAKSSKFNQILSPLNNLKSDNENDSDEEGEKETVKTKIENYYQKRLSLEPKQVIRYAYNGKPLWMTHPVPSISSIPVCEGCGSKRIFEYQLLSTLLSLIPAIPPSNKSNKKAHIGISESPSKPSLESVLGSGMDFGVVTVWTCPINCDCPNLKYCKEFTLVQTSAEL